MNFPKISIVLPNLNMATYIKERFDTILAQTYTEWELVIVDGYSSDGSWNIIQEYANEDKRIRIFQKPPLGLCDAFNKGIQLARGEYVYIATCDDTMTPDCIEKMVSAFDEHPECDICRCCLTIINEHGEPHPTRRWENMPSQKFHSHLIRKKHVRLAPFDGFLHFGLWMPTLSFTQIMIRRSLFDKIGFLKLDWGSRSDFEWHMRAGLVCNIIHLPEYLATWRIHGNQATQDNFPDANRVSIKLEMINEAWKIFDKFPEKKYGINVKNDFLKQIKSEIIKFSIQSHKAIPLKLLHLLKVFMQQPPSTLRYCSDALLQHILRKNRYAIKAWRMRKNLQKINLDNKIKEYQ
jgi:glycosyltransferase involved in cell wall biosynthesis